MLQETLIAISKKLKDSCRSGTCRRFALIGDLAVSARGFVRSTQDIDFLVDVDLKNCVKLASELGGVFSPPDLGDPLDGVIRLENQGVFVQAIRLSPRLTDVALGDVSDVELEAELVPVIGTTGLIILKMYAGSDFDLEDARQVLRAQAPTMNDLANIQKFATDLGLLEKLNEIL